jgi:hypothetical protein
MVAMKSMSMQQAKAFWSYLHSQEEIKLQAYVSAPIGSPFKDEKIAEAETYHWLSEKFAENFIDSISNADNILCGLSTLQTRRFLDYLNDQVNQLALSCERVQRNGKGALTKADDIEYSNMGRIYKGMVRQTECQQSVFENSRQQFISILEKI